MTLNQHKYSTDDPLKRARRKFNKLSKNIFSDLNNFILTKLPKKGSYYACFELVFSDGQKFNRFYPFQKVRVRAVHTFSW